MAIKDKKGKQFNPLADVGVPPNLVFFHPLSAIEQSGKPVSYLSGFVLPLKTITRRYIRHMFIFDFLDTSEDATNDVT